MLSGDDMWMINLLAFGCGYVVGAATLIGVVVLGGGMGDKNDK